MKKAVSFVLVCIFLLGMIGCTSQPQQAQGNQLFVEGNVIRIEVSSLPENYKYSFEGADAKAIIDYLSALNLQSNFEENPNEYAGMTWVISLEYETGDILNVYHFGNLFIRSEKGAWYKMAFEEASRFQALLEQWNG